MDILKNIKEEFGESPKLSITVILLLACSIALGFFFYKEKATNKNLSLQIEDLKKDIVVMTAKNTEIDKQKDQLVDMFNAETAKRETAEQQLSILRAKNHETDAELEKCKKHEEELKFKIAKKEKQWKKQLELAQILPEYLLDKNEKNNIYEAIKDRVVDSPLATGPTTSLDLHAGRIMIAAGLMKEDGSEMLNIKESIVETGAALLLIFDEATPIRIELYLQSEDGIWNLKRAFNIHRTEYIGYMRNIPGYFKKTKP